LTYVFYFVIVKELYKKAIKVCFLKNQSFELNYRIEKNQSRKKIKKNKKSAWHCKFNLIY